MRKGILSCVVWIVLLLIANNVFAQTAEQQVKSYLDKVKYWRYQYSPEDSGVDPNASANDSVLYANKMLLTYFQQNTSLLNSNFKTTDEADITVATSDDRKMRIYSWDTETGDEMHIYDAVMQFDAGGIKTSVLNDISQKADKKDAGYLYPEIFTLNDSRKYYLVVYSSILSAKDAKKGVRAFVIENNSVNDANIFQTANDLTNKIEYTYDYYSNYDYKGMKEKQVIHLEKQKLYIPLVEGDKINGKWNVYKLEGGKLVPEK